MDPSAENQPGSDPSANNPSLEPSSEKKHRRRTRTRVRLPKDSSDASSGPDPSSEKHGRRTRVRIKTPMDPVAHRQYRREQLISRVKVVFYWTLGIAVFCLFIYYMLTKIPTR